MTTNSNPVVPPFILYGAERSYFTGKVRPALRAKRVYFEEVLATGDVYAEIKRRTGLRFIPVVVTPEDDTWQDTSIILDELEKRFPTPALVPSTPVQRIASYLWEIYADEFMILPAMHYRWSTPEGAADARGSFAAAGGDADAANKFADLMSGMIPALGVTPETAPVIEAHLADLLDAMNTLLGDQAFLFGDQMSLADCAIMGPLYAHLFLDLVPGGMLRRTAPRVAHWIERMNHPNPRAFTGFTTDDKLHEQMPRLFSLIGADAVPVLLATLADFERWADENAKSGDEAPRAIGFHETSLRGITFSRYTSAYTLWLVQRLWDACAALGDDERATVERAFQGTGCEALLDYKPRHRMGKQGFKLVFA